MTVLRHSTTRCTQRFAAAAHLNAAAHAHIIRRDSLFGRRLLRALPRLYLFPALLQPLGFNASAARGVPDYRRKYMRMSTYHCGEPRPPSVQAKMPPLLAQLRRK